VSVQLVMREDAERLARDYAVRLLDEVYELRPFALKSANVRRSVREHLEDELVDVLEKLRLPDEPQPDALRVVA
jgi:NTP pyrophosphatase (non-canonical NTP hydrolase)